MQRKSMISSEQIRAARAWLRWTRQRLADESGVPWSTIADYEAGRTVSMLAKNEGKLEAAINRGGVEFTNANHTHGAGLRWRSAK